MSIVILFQVLFGYSEGLIEDGTFGVLLLAELFLLRLKFRTTEC